MKLWQYTLAAFALAGALFAGFYFLRPHPGDGRTGMWSSVEWQRMASPGALSGPHAFLEHNCAACHTPGRGVAAANCVACHANEQSLLKRQPTAFHADVSECATCHVEHQERGARPAGMDHDLFARLGERQLRRAPSADASKRAAADRIARLVKGSSSAVLPHADISPGEAALDCNACHGNQDRHRESFGKDCAQCHGTRTWGIPEFRHPPPGSVDCAQCHQAPPSHYMMHFEMVSMKVARREHVEVSQCYACHQTTSWNDIKGVGWYKHH